jgi:glycosyltransferase involved in cell wall biosynthesis
MEPRITTVIPTYRRPKLLPRAIMSVLRQTFPHFEVHVYDNASGDETRQVVERLAATDPRVKYHCHERNIGLVPNFAYGMERVATRFFNLLSDDDLVFPRFFELGLSALDRHADAILFAGTTIWATPDGEIRDIPLGRWRDGIYQPPEGLFEIIRRGHPDFTGTLFRRDVMSRIGTLDPAVGNPCDVDYFCRCAAQQPIAVSTTPCGMLSQHPSSATVQEPYAPSAYWPAYEKIADNIASLGVLSEQERLRARALILRDAHKNIFLRGFKASTHGYREEATQAATILRESFSDRRGALLVRVGSLFPTGFGFLFNVASRAGRLLRMRRRRDLVPSQVRSNCATALRALLAETSSHAA